MWTRLNQYDSLSNPRACVFFIHERWQYPHQCPRTGVNGGCCAYVATSDCPSTCHNPSRRKTVYTASWQQPVRGVRSYVRAGSVWAPSSTNNLSKWLPTLTTSFDDWHTCMSNDDHRTARWPVIHAGSTCHLRRNCCHQWLIRHWPISSHPLPLLSIHLQIYHLRNNNRLNIECCRRPATHVGMTTCLLKMKIILLVVNVILFMMICTFLKVTVLDVCVVTPSMTATQRQCTAQWHISPSTSYPKTFLWRFQ